MGHTTAIPLTTVPARTTRNREAATSSSTLTEARLSTARWSVQGFDVSQIAMVAIGTSRHFAVTQQFGRFRSEADIQRAAFTVPDL
jgi:hypothetical protein